MFDVEDDCCDQPWYFYGHDHQASRRVRTGSVLYDNRNIDPAQEEFGVYFDYRG